MKILEEFKSPDFWVKQINSCQKGKGEINTIHFRKRQVNKMLNKYLGKMVLTKNYMFRTILVFANDCRFLKSEMKIINPIIEKHKFDISKGYKRIWSFQDHSYINECDIFPFKGFIEIKQRLNDHIDKKIIKIKLEMMIAKYYLKQKNKLIELMINKYCNHLIKKDIPEVVGEKIVDYIFPQYEV